MGCDIHLFAEFGAGGPSYEALADGEFLVGRSYALFAALAGVRPDPGFLPLVSPRGLPIDVSQHVSSHYFLPVLDDERARSWAVNDYMTPEAAEACVQAGTAARIPLGMTPPLMAGPYGHVTRPDWHSASWLQVHEVHLALEHAGCAPDATTEEFQLFLLYLDAVVARKGSSTRIVFWFDN